MEKQMKAYLSLPISDKPWDEVKKNNKAGKRLAAAIGFEPISPLDGLKGENWEWSDYMFDDLQKLTSCDAMFVLCSRAESKESYGVQIEILWAERLGIPVLYAPEQSTEIGIESFWQK